MSQFKKVMKNCPVCGKESEHYVILSWYSGFGQMPEMIDECPYCKYISKDFNIDKPKRDVEAIIKSNNYKFYTEQPKEYYDSIIDPYKPHTDDVNFDTILDCFIHNVGYCLDGDLYNKEFVENHSITYRLSLNFIARIHKEFRYLMVNDLNKKQKKIIKNKIKGHLNNYKKVLKQFIKQIRTGKPLNLDKYELELLKDTLFMKTNEVEAFKKVTTPKIYQEMIKSYKKYILSECEIEVGGYKLKI